MELPQEGLYSQYAGPKGAKKIIQMMYTFYVKQIEMENPRVALLCRLMRSAEAENDGISIYLVEERERWLHLPHLLLVMTNWQIVQM